MTSRILVYALCITFAFTLISSASITTLTYDFPTPTVESISGQTMVIMAGSPNWGIPGEPFLPAHSVNLLLPPGESAVDIIIDTADPIPLGDGYVLSPTQAQAPLSTGPAFRQTPPNAAIYSNDEVYPAESVNHLTTQFLAGHGIALANLYPVIYKPLSGEVSYYPWIKVTVIGQPTPEAQTSYATKLKRSEVIQDRLADLIDNPEASVIYGPEPPTDPEDYDLLVITIADFLPLYQDYIDYKTRSGFRTAAVTISTILANYSGIDLQEQIRNCIIDYYESYNISSVFLCGDNEHIPARSFWCIDDALPSDLYYAALDGNWNNDYDDLYGEAGEEDLFAEVFVGRSCADNETEIAHVVNKLMKFQTEPVVDKIETGLMIGEDLGWASWGYEYKEEVRLGSSSWGYTTAGFPANFDVGQLYEYPGSSWSAMSDLLPLLNEGPVLVNHLGHANWNYTLKFGNSQINDQNFTNDGVNHNFFIGYSQGCICGDFAHFMVDCILEYFTTIEHGAVAFIGNSRYGWGSYNNTNGASQHYDRQFFDAIFGEDITRIGAAHQDSKEDNASSVAGDDIMRWCYYDNNLLGDPTMDIWTAAPGYFDPVLPDAVTEGSTSLEITDIAVSGALVTVSRDNEIIGQGTSDGSGNAYVLLDQPLQGEGTLDVMVTAHNMIPWSGTTLAIPATGAYVVYSDCIVADESGNNNGLLDYAELTALTLDVLNVGVDPSGTVDFTLSSDDTLVTILDASGTLSNLQPGASGNLSEAFTIQTSPLVEDGHELVFTLFAQEGSTVWTSEFSILCHAPKITLQDFTIDDSEGNNNNRIDPGETFNIEVIVLNEGSCDALESGFELMTAEEMVTIPVPTIDGMTLLSGGEMTLVFENLTIDENFMQGDSIAFDLNISTSAGYEGLQSFLTCVGDLQFRPVGPDVYGYWAYDSFDGPEAPLIDWDEIAPIAGGPGTDLQLGTDDKITIDLPFSFQFYGNVYNQINVGSHGWICFEPLDIFFPQNIYIPHIVEPNGAVFGYWDELDPGADGFVCSYHDVVEQRFIIEWFMVPHEGSSTNFETFQIILLDPVTTNTPTGDGEIITQYLNLSSAQNGCTIGIEDPTGTKGLQYVYNGSYDVSATSLTDNLAIRFTTVGSIVGVQPSLPNEELPQAFSLGQNYPNPFNPSTSISFDLPMASHISLNVYDVSGCLVAEIIEGFRQAGRHEVTFDATGLASGVYLYRLEAGEFIGTGKMVLMK